ncbi:MAG TPA: hypothetical protein VLH09_01535 [Bryobacteraceae bacterium]|nr:hypothetical protein [Bryobacteraceae bacterium]
MKLAKWRLAAGVAALLVLALVVARLAPAYWRNLAFQRALMAVARESAPAETPDDAVRVKVVHAAAGMGIAVGLDQVRVRRAKGRLEIEVLYDVTAGLPYRLLDLHFRPRARVP